jgi:hypothetical protein
MKTACPGILCLLLITAACASGQAQDARPAPACPAATCTKPPACGLQEHCLNCFRWTNDCFPRSGCPDDYCPNPYPRQCWPPYPPFYRCVPAGDCVQCGCSQGKDKLSWWFLPTPQALREALWCRP